MTPVIKFEALGEDSSSLARELVCTVWLAEQSDEQSSSEKPVISQRSILVGSSDASEAESQVELPSPGTYLVDVGFPSGRHTRRTVSVTAEEPYRFYLRESRYPPKVASRSSPLRLKEFPRVLMSAARSMVSYAELEIRLASTPMADKPMGVRHLRGFVEALEAEGRDGEVIDKHRVADLSHSLLLPAAPGSVASANYRRSWLIVSGQGQNPTLVAYPREWESADSNEPFRLTTRRKSKTGAEATKWSVSLEMRDPTYGSMLEYMTRRDWHSIAVVSNSMRASALTALYEEQMNPFAAAAGAYMFALGETDALNRQWQWMDSLTDRFPWLPDGPIALGFRMLRDSEKGSEQFNSARQLLVTATERGLPYFTIGLHTLVDAFNFLVMASPEDTEVKELLAAVTAADLACVRTEVFCTLQMTRYKRLPQGPVAVR